MENKSERIVALLGPTNTGKTFFAIEKMTSYDSGIIGLPLRLLAREVYDKVVVKKGKLSVALITGEEQIIPPKAKYFMKFHKLNIFLIVSFVIILSQISLKFFLISINTAYIILLLPIILIFVFYFLLLMRSKFKFNLL